MNINYLSGVFRLFVILFLLYQPRAMTFSADPASKPEVGTKLKIGWASADITPDEPVVLAGQFHARVSEGIKDPVTATVLIFESLNGAGSSEKVILISCDLIKIADEFRDKVRELIRKDLPEIQPGQIILNATHTHTAPYCSSHENLKDIYGIELSAMAPGTYLDLASQRIATATRLAWNNRAEGGISYGLGQAVLSHNRLIVNYSGNSVMYGNTTKPEFSHVEGYVDHSVNLLYTWDKDKNLTGVVINVPVPSQVSEQLYQISADFWHDVRIDMRKRLGREIYILPQCSAAGDQSPHILIGRKAEERMQRITGMDKEGQGLRKQIAMRITDAVISILPYMKETIEWNPIVIHQTENAELSRRLMNTHDLNKALNEAGKWAPQFDSLLHKIDQNPALKKEPRWYKDITIAHSRLRRGTVVKQRHELEKTNPKMQVEVHIIRIGDIAIATNPFELYLDYALRIKARSPAIQTFVVQLAGGGTYLPPQRSVTGGSYGAEAASTTIGPEGGRELVEKTLEIINRLWKE